MADSSSSPDRGPVSLATLLDEAQRRLPAAGSEAPRLDGFLFSGNPHESVPRALFLDVRLTPLERNAWQVVRLQLNQDGVTAFPSYEQLRPYLASMPCGPQASFETIARALTILRLTRWLSLVRRRRDKRTGRVQGNLYVLHDDPLTPWEAMQLDPEYLSLVSHALSHASKTVQTVGHQTLKEITQDPMVQGRSLPTRLQVLAQRMAAQHGVAEDETPKEPAASGAAIAAPSYPQQQFPPDSEVGKNYPLRNAGDLISESVAGLNAPQTGPLRNPKQDRTVRNSINKEVRTVPRASGHERLRLPERFMRLKDEQQQGALAALHQVDSDMQQAVLDEWNTRCQSSTVRHPAGYLFGIIQKALRGEFKVWAGQAQKARTSRPPAVSEPSAPPSPPAEPEVAQQHIAKLRDLLGLR